MQKPATAPWGLRISDADLEKLKAGLEPQDHDDKWRISAKNPNESDYLFIHLARTGTNLEHFILHVKPSDSGSTTGGEIEAITWEQQRCEQHISEEYAKKEVVLITRGISECDYDALPEYHSSDLDNC